MFGTDYTLEIAVLNDFDTYRNEAATKRNPQRSSLLTV
jgi:hypothetical protein